MNKGMNEQTNEERSSANRSKIAFQASEARPLTPLAQALSILLGT